MKKLFCVALFILLVNPLYSQIRNRDSVVAASLFSANFGAFATGGDFAARYTSSYSIGAAYQYKTSNNWLFGVNFNYHFGNDFTGNDPFAALRTNSLDIISSGGDYSQVRANQRGYRMGMNVGKILNFFGPNPNSGLLLEGGAGYIRHRLDIVNPGNDVPQINDEYEKGYDELHTGFYTSQYIAYAHLGSKRYVNFTIGFEFIQGFTKNARKFNYATGEYDLGNKLDLYTGIKLSWIIPVYSKNQQKYYYY